MNQSLKKIIMYLPILLIILSAHSAFIIKENITSCCPCSCRELVKYTLSNFDYISIMIGRIIGLRSKRLLMNFLSAVLT